MALNLKHQTAAEFAARLRERYRNSSREETARIAKIIVARIQAGDFTDTQVRNIFGLSVAQWDALKTKMQNLIANYDAIQSAGGE